MNTIHICFEAEPEDFALFNELTKKNFSKQRGFYVLCEHYRKLDDSKKDSFCIFNTTTQKPIPINFNVYLADSILLDTIKAKYNLLSNREAFHVICNAFRGTSETAETAEKSQIEPSIEIIRSTPKQAKQTIARIELEKQRLELMDAFRQKEFERDKERLALEDAFKQKSFERRMKYVASTAKPIPNAEKIDPTSIGDGNCKFQGVIIDKKQKSDRCRSQSGDAAEDALTTGFDRKNEFMNGKDNYPIADAYGYFGNWDWTPEQIAKMELSIPCKGFETNEEYYENWKTN